MTTTETEETTMGKTVNQTKPYHRLWFRGKQMDERTMTAFLWAEKRYRRNLKTNKPRGKNRRDWSITQGCYNPGGVTASAGTHDGGGVLDISISGMNQKQIRAAVKWLRKAGFAAWFRDWPGNQHIHAVLLGHRTASPGAQQQMTAYRNHRDGLAGNAYDSTWRPDPLVRWSHRRNKPYVPK